MPKYTADHFAIRIATSEAALDSAAELTGWDSIDFTAGQGRKKVPVGIGSRMQEVHVTLLDYSGSMSGNYDGLAVAGSADVLIAFGMFVQSELTPLYVRITNKVTLKTVTLKKVVGDVSPSIGSAEDFYSWSIDFDFEDITYT